MAKWLTTRKKKRTPKPHIQVANYLTLATNTQAGDKEKQDPTLVRGRKHPTARFPQEQGCGIKGFLPTSVLQVGIPLYMNKIVFGKPFLYQGLGPPVVPFSPLFLVGRGSPTKIDYRKNIGFQLILASQIWRTCQKWIPFPTAHSPQEQHAGHCGGLGAAGAGETSGSSLKSPAILLAFKLHQVSRLVIRRLSSLGGSQPSGSLAC